MSSTRGWLVGREGSRAILDVILLRQPEIAFVFWRLQHTPLTHTELIVGENLSLHLGLVRWVLGLRCRTSLSPGHVSCC